jgi:hypothetical protein
MHNSLDRADSMCWGNRCQCVLTIDLSINSNLVEDFDERWVFNKNCLSKLPIHGLPQTCSLSSIQLLLLQMVYCLETAQISSHTILSQTGLWNLFIKIISKLLANSMVTMLCALLNTFPEQWGTKRTCDTLFVGTCQHWCQSNSLSQMKIPSSNYRNSKCGKQKQNTWQGFPNRIRLAFGSDTRLRIVDQSPPYI